MTEYHPSVIDKCLFAYHSMLLQMLLRPELACIVR